MSDLVEDAQAKKPERIQDFIFSRELAEVYLLLDHLSGRADKSLAAAMSDSDKSGKVTIENICKIGWPPEGTKIEQASQAETLLLAKDSLNHASKPASGASIAFTLMVAGDEDAGLSRGRRRWYHFGRRARAESKPPTNPPDSARPKGQPDPIPPKTPPAAVATTKPDADGGADSSVVGPAAGPFGGRMPPPSRGSLAKMAYPGLVQSAAGFRRLSFWALVGLFAWLVFTCFLSWNIAVGRAVVARLDAQEKDRAAIEARIEKVEGAGAPSTNAPPQQAGSGSPASPASGQPASALPIYIQDYCEQALTSAVANKTDGKADQKRYEGVICKPWVENRLQYGSSCEHIKDWLSFWRFWRIEDKPAYLAGNAACTVAPKGLSAATLSEHQRASVLLEVLATLVLPICYGFLGAGAAVVRDIWGKMRDSLLLPRDFTLSLQRMALGAVIGACIGLFISPSGTAAQAGPTLTTAVALTPSALSFIAGFGVEGVFVALETLIKRVFGITEQKTS